LGISSIFVGFFKSSSFLCHPVFGCDRSVVKDIFCSAHTFAKSSLYSVTQKKRELLKCVVAAMYSWQHCGTGDLSYRQPRHFSNHGSDLKRQVIMFQFLSIMFFWGGFLQFLLGFSKVPLFCVTLYLVAIGQLLRT